MAKLNPLTLQRTSSVTETKTFTDPLQPGQELTLTFTVSPDVSTDTLRGQRTAEFVRQYVTGDARYQETKDEKEPGGEPPAILHVDTPSGPAKLFATQQMCSIIADLTVSEEAGGDEDPYNFYQWLLLARDMPNAFDEIAVWHDSLTRRARGLVKNRSGASGEVMSPSPSSAT